MGGRLRGIVMLKKGGATRPGARKLDDGEQAPIVRGRGLCRPAKEFDPRHDARSLFHVKYAAGFMLL